MFSRASLLVVLATALLSGSGGIARAQPAQAERLYGVWVKETVVDHKARNQDPRWQLRLTLERDGRLSYESRSTTEIWLTNGQARSSSEQISIAGRWSFNDRGEIVIELGRKPTPAETLHLSTNLNFDATAGRAIVILDFAGALLRLSGLPGDREIYFKKVKNL